MLILRSRCQPIILCCDSGHVVRLRQRPGSRVLEVTLRGDPRVRLLDVPRDNGATARLRLPNGESVWLSWGPRWRLAIDAPRSVRITRDQVKKRPSAAMEEAAEWLAKMQARKAGAGAE